MAAFTKLQLLAAKVHFTSFAFFVDRQSPLYLTFLTNAYESAAAYIQTVLDIDMDSNALLQYCPSEIPKTLTSASCILIKIIHSSYAVHFNVIQGKSLFNSAILAFRAISLRKNDFPDRSAEALARMWRVAGSGMPRDGSISSQLDPLDLKIRSRMSVSHVYDCVWGWRRTINSQNTLIPTNTSSSIQAQQPYAALPPFPAYGQHHSFGISTLEDSDLFNSLDWIL